MRDCIPIEKRVALSITCLGSGNNLLSCGKPFGILNSTTSIIVKLFYHVVKIHLMPLVIPKLTLSRIAKINTDFENFAWNSSCIWCN
jgi:hypothetical protein